MLTVCLFHSVHMVHSWTTYGLQGRVNIKQHRLCVIYINRVAIQQRLFVKFSCDSYINSLLRALLVCVIIGLCDQWLLQHILLRSVVRVEDSGLYLFSFHFSFLFYFSFILFTSNLRLGINVTLCYISITCYSHDHTITCYTEGHRKFQNNDVIQHVLYMLIL